MTEKKTPEPPAAPASPNAALQALFDKETAAGVRGTPPDPTPNENYTVAGVVDPNVHVPEEFKIQTGVTVLPEDVVTKNS